MMIWLTQNWMVVSGVVTFLASGVTWLWAQKRSAKDANDDLLERHIDRLQAELTVCRDQCESLMNELSQLKVEHAVLNAKGGAQPPAEILKQFIREFPGLIWAKRRLKPGVFSMLAVSRDYAATYLAGPPELYDDLRDEEIYGDELGRLMNEADEEAYKAQTRIEVLEEIRTAPSGVVGTFDGIKWSVRLADGTDLIFGFGKHVYE